MSANDQPAVPTARVRPERRLSWMWIAPVVAVALAAWLVVTSVRDRGVLVSVQLPDGHGLKVGDEVRYRGITVGGVTAVTLDDEIANVLVTMQLDRDADRLAVVGSRFWVVRPRFRPTGVDGLETIFGPRYLAVEPGPAGGKRQRFFVGLAEPPVLLNTDPDDLEIVLEAKRRGSLRPGAPVGYRQVRIGTVRSVALASDGGLVEARVHIAKKYRELIRRGSRFWDVGGIEAELGLSGISLDIDSIEEVIGGGVAVATPEPEDAGPAVHTGARFRLNERAEDDWLEWRPTAPIGSDLLPPGASLPQPLRATLTWRQGLVFKGTRSHSGWLLMTEHGLVGPADLLRPPDKADDGTTSLEVSGQRLPVRGAPPWSDNGIARLDAAIETSPWPIARMRRARKPEDCIAIGDAGAAPMPLATSRLSRDGARWRLDSAVPIGPSWHGASVIAREDGKLVGIILVNDDDEAEVALLPAVE